MNTVEKFGGSSMAWPLHVAQRIEADAPRIAVVSAPGRDGRNKTNGEKMTDLLRDNRVDDALHRAEEVARRSDLPLHEQTATVDVLDQWVHRYSDNTWARAAGGERFSAELIARMTGRQVLDPLEYIFINSLDRTPDVKLSVRALTRKLHESDNQYVLPGFYGRAVDTHDTVPRTMERGGSDTTGALAALALRAEYVNLSDVSGVYSGDPERYDDAKLQNLITYQESRAFAFFGNEVLHPEVARILGRTGLDTWLGSVRESEPKTRITSSRDATPTNNYIGIASRNVWQLDMRQTGMDSQAGVASNIYDIFTEHNISYLSSYGGPDRTSILVPDSNDNYPGEVIRSLNERTSGFSISIHPVALAGVVLTSRQPYLKSIGSVTRAIEQIAPDTVPFGDLDRREVGMVIEREDRDRIEDALHSMIIND